MSAEPRALTPRLRPMTSADVPAVMVVERAAYPFPWTESIFRDCLRVGYCCWVLEDHVEVIGYSVLSVAAGESHLLNLCVTPERHRHGLGARLLAHMLEVARGHGAETVFLEVRPSNDAALALYARAGFVEVGARRDYYPAGRGRREDAVVLARQL